MLRSKRILLALATAALLALPALSIAAPTHEGTLSEAAGKFEWDGGPLTGANAPHGDECAAPQCESTLLKIDIPAGSTGKLKIDVGDFGQQDLELYVFTSDASGTPLKLLGASEGAPGSAEAFTIAKAGPGFYLVQVSAYIGAGAVYKGKADLSGVTAGSAPTVPTGPTPPTSGDALPPSGELSASVAMEPASPKGASVGGVPLKVTCSVVCKGTFAVKISKSQARKLKLGKKAMTIGKGNFTVDKRNQLVQVKLTKKAAKKVAKAKKVAVSIAGTVTDSSGGQKKAANAKGTLKK